MPNKREKIRWGILGTGRIAHQFADAVGRSAEGVLVAAASLTPGKAQAFAEKHPGARPFASYEALVAEGGVDAVYVANVHSMHRDATLLALGAGKAVLCEKPMAHLLSHTEAMVARAREKGVFLMEAMWTRFLPVTRAVYDLALSGALGEVRCMHGAFAGRVPYDPASRIYSPALAGGALPDIGVYPLAYILGLFGEVPERVAGEALLSPEGMDSQFSAVLRYPDRLATVTCSVLVTMDSRVAIYGTEGWVEVPRFWDATSYTLHRGEEVTRVEMPHENGFVFEVEEVHRCLRAGKLESDIWPLSKTLAVSRVMETLRTAFRVRYPDE